MKLKGKAVDGFRNVTRCALGLMAAIWMVKYGSSNDMLWLGIGGGLTFAVSAGLLPRAIIQIANGRAVDSSFKMKSL